MSWLAILGFGKSIGKAILKWLSHRSFWQIVCMGLGVLIIVQHFQIADARHDRDAYHRQRDEYKSKLDAISAKRNEQKLETKTRIVTVEKQIRHADDEAKKVEQAPLPGNCESPKAVLDADI